MVILKENVMAVGNPQLDALMAAMGKRSGMSKPGAPYDPMAQLLQQGNTSQMPEMPEPMSPAGVPGENLAADVPPPPTDEQTLDDVHNQMGKPPPHGPLKWENLKEDQAALEQEPTDGNIQAFIDYWGEDKLPERMQNDSEESGETPGAPDEREA